MTDQDKQNIETVRRAYQAGEEVISPDIVWHVPGHNPVSGVYRGAKAYREDMVARMGATDEWIVDINEIMINGNYASVSINLRGLRKGHRIYLNGAHLLRLENGKIVEGWGFTENQDVLDEFFSA
jgi:ketosteroid isomerase-like protein